VNNVSGSFSVPVPITPVGQLPAGIQSLEIDDQNRLYTSYQSSQSASGKGFYLLFAENGVFNDTILIADIPPEYVTRNSSQVVTKGNGDIAMFYAEGDVRNDTVICDIFMKRGNIYNIIPVELSNFTSEISGNEVLLNWTTSTETNNSGFEIERQVGNRQFAVGKWETIGFVPGFGTTTEPKSYSFVDEDITSGIYKYRLKQIDFDGTFEFSNEIEVEVDFTPKEFVLYQNYPNPFNPTTVISYHLPVASNVTLKVYDILGNDVATLVNEEKQPGVYEVEFNSQVSHSGEVRNLTSGIYFYQLKTDSFTQAKKMIVVK
jgi:hypothetical protein